MWGGGFGGGGGMFQGGSASANGLPFGGIPTELMDEATKLLATEPHREASRLHFTQRPREDERRRLSLTQIVRPYPRYVVSGSALVVVTSLVLQAGPKLTEYAIDHGMLPGHHSLGVITWCALIYLALAVVSAFLQRAQVVVTGTLASRVMHDLRIRVFTHFKRLSLDFFTDEKAGVLMSRMTSDI